jgi:hypothetical protein
VRAFITIKVFRGLAAGTANPNGAIGSKAVGHGFLLTYADTMTRGILRRNDVSSGYTDLFSGGC